MMDKVRKKLNSMRQKDNECMLESKRKSDKDTEEGSKKISEKDQDKLFNLFKSQEQASINTEISQTFSNELQNNLEWRKYKFQR